MTDRRYTSQDELVDFIQRQWQMPEDHPFFLCLQDDPAFREHVREALKQTGKRVNDQFWKLIRQYGKG